MISTSCSKILDKISAIEGSNGAFPYQQIRQRIVRVHRVLPKDRTPWATCYRDFHPSRWITLCMAFPYPAADSLDLMDHLLSFDFSLIIPKTIWKIIYTAFYPITAYIRGFEPYNRVHQDVCIIQILLEFFLDMDPTHSTPGLPYALRSLGFDLSLSLWKINKEPLGTLKE